MFGPCIVDPFYVWRRRRGVYSRFRLALKSKIISKLLSVGREMTFELVILQQVQMRPIVGPDLPCLQFGAIV